MSDPHDKQDSYEFGPFSFTGLSNRRYVVLDLEATGPDSATDSVTQIGAVALYDDGPCDSESFSRFVRPWKRIPEKIERLTDISNEEVASADDFAAVWVEFAEFCSDSTLVTQCGYEFDLPLLQRECARIDADFMCNVWLDTKAVFAMLHPDRFETFSTDFLTDHYGINRAAFARHDALGDARLISRIFHRQLEEAKSSGLDQFSVDSTIRVKRSILPPL